MDTRRTRTYGVTTFKRSLNESLVGLAMEGKGAAITVVHGGAGCGKTFALLDAARTADRFVVASLRDHHASLFAFVGAVAQALAPVVRGPSQSFSAVHERLAMAHDPIPPLVRWLAAHVGGTPVTVAVDRLECVAADQRIVALIEAVAKAECGLRWILSTRTMGALPIDSWMSRGLMAMPFEAEATTAYVDPVLLFDSLSGKHRHALEAAVELPSLDVALLEGVGLERGFETIRALRTAFPDLFELGEPLEMRHDVRIACIERLKREDLPRYSTIVRTTGAVLERERRFEDALRLYSRTMQIEPLYRLLERYGLDVWETVSPETLDLALRLVPRESQPESGIVLALRAAAASRAKRTDISETLYVNAIDISQGEVRSRIAYAYGCDLLRRNRADAIDVLRVLVGDEMPRACEAAVRSALAQAYCMRDDVARANVECAAALDAAAAAGDPWTSALVYTRAAYVRLYADNDVPAAEMLASQGLCLAESTRAYVTAVGALSILYNVACEADDPPKAIGYLRKLAEHGAKIGSVEFASYALLAELEFETEAYDLPAIALTNETLRSFDVHYEARAASDGLLPSEALQLTWRGDFERAYRILEPSIVQQQGEDFRALRASQVALYAAASDALEVAAARVEEALHLLARLDTDSQKCVRARIYVAVTLSMLGQVELAEHVFADVEAGVARFPRLGAVATMASLVHRLWNGDAVSDELLAACETVREYGFGGLAAMFARLPMKVAVRERVASTARAATALQYAKIVPLIERYRDVPVSL